jgi:hypothetical protein
VVDNKRCVQGRWIGAEEILCLKRWIEQRPEWSRKRLAKGLCERWDWRDQRGRLKDFAARSLLLKLEASSQIQLPPLREHNRRSPRKAPLLPFWQEPLTRQGLLAEVQPLRVCLVKSGTEEWKRWAFYLEKYHYLGLRVVGENLGYLIRDRQGEDLACLLFGAAAWKCAARDQFLGWDSSARANGLNRIANNTRFLILPWVRVNCLASHILGRVSRRIEADWQIKYGHGLDWLETFVEMRRFTGQCYRAANWRSVGQTQGRGRQDREHQQAVPAKLVFLYPLGK